MNFVSLENTYHLLITIFFISVYFLVNFKIKRTEKKRLKGIKNREINDAIETESPYKNQEKVLKQYGIDAMEFRFSFMAKAFPVILFLIWILLSLIPYLGSIPTVYISLITAVISVIIGVSFRPFLENLFAGVIISFFRSIKVGDTVRIDGHYGLIEEITLTYAVLKRWDWNRIIIPNSQLLQKEIQNLTMKDEYIWAHIEFFVAPDADLELVEKMAIESAKESEYFADKEDPSFWVIELEKDAIRCWIAAWAGSPSDAWELRNDTRKFLHKKLRNHKIRFHENYHHTAMPTS